MKRIIHTILILTAAAVLWTGCDRFEPAEDTGRAIRFTTSEAESRVQETTASSIASFRVSAVWKKAPGDYVTGYMDGQAVEKGGNNEWIYSPVMYMPTYGSVNFFAYSPANAAVGDFIISGAAHDQVGIMYDVTTDYATQHDFMVASAVEETTTPVSLEFKHVLSSIKVEAKCAQAGYKLRIYEVKLLNLRRQGILMGTTSGSPATTEWSWSVLPARANYTIAQSGSYVEASTDFVPVSDPAAGPLMILPQTSAGDVFVQVTYDVYDMVGNPIERNHIDAIPFGIDCKIGEKYVLRLNLYTA